MNLNQIFLDALKNRSEILEKWSRELEDAKDKSLLNKRREEGQRAAKEERMKDSLAQSQGHFSPVEVFLKHLSDSNPNLILDGINYELPEVLQHKKSKEFDNPQDGTHRVRLIIVEKKDGDQRVELLFKTTPEGRMGLALNDNAPYTYYCPGTGQDPDFESVGDNDNVWVTICANQKSSSEIIKNALELVVAYNSPDNDAALMGKITQFDTEELVPAHK